MTAIWIQTAVMFLTGAVVVWYTIETYRLRKETVRSNRIATRPIVLPEFKPVTLSSYGLFLKNSGAGCATNVHVLPIPIEVGQGIEEFMGHNEIRFESIDHLEVGEEEEISYGNFCDGKKSPTSQFDAWFFPHTTSKVAVHLRIRFEDVERHKYEIVVTIEPEENTAKLPRKVRIGPIEEIKSS